MEFIKKHYEKIIMSVVLLCLLGAAVWLPRMISDAREQIKINAGSEPPDRPWKPTVDFNLQTNALQKLEQPVAVPLSGGTPPEYHNLFNPVTWKLTSSNTLFKVYKEGPDALVAMDIRPLYLTVAFDRSAGTGYYFYYQTLSGKKNNVYLHVKETAKVAGKPVFTLVGIKGTPEDPTEFQIQMLDTQETVTVTKTTPFQKVDGYVVDLTYPPENLNLKNKHVGDSFTLAGETYKIVAISKNAVRVAADNGKQTTITWSGTTPAP
jgi:hypothetical protein